MPPQRLTDKPQIWGTTQWPFSHRPAAVNMNHPASPEMSTVPPGAFSKGCSQKASADLFSSNKLLYGE